jgi:hypothetical protein
MQMPEKRRSGARPSQSLSRHGFLHLLVRPGSAPTPSVRPKSARYEEPSTFSVGRLVEVRSARLVEAQALP